MTEMARVTAIFDEALRVKKSEKTLAPGLWVKNEPWLRLLHCILDDEIRPSYLQRDRVASRPTLDAFSSPDRAQSVYKRIALKWNNPFLALSPVFPTVMMTSWSLLTLAGML